MKDAWISWPWWNINPEQKRYFLCITATGPCVFKAGFELKTYVRMNLNFGFSCLHLLSAGVIGMHHHFWSNYLIIKRYLKKFCWLGSRSTASSDRYFWNANLAGEWDRIFCISKKLSGTVGLMSTLQLSPWYKMYRQGKSELLLVPLSIPVPQKSKKCNYRRWGSFLGIVTWEILLGMVNSTWGGGTPKAVGIHIRLGINPKVARLQLLKNCSSQEREVSLL